MLVGDDPGVVAKGIQAAVPRHAGGDAGLGLVFVADIADLGFDQGAASGGQFRGLLHRFFQAVCGHVRKEDRRTFRREFERRGPADARPGSGEEEDLIIEASHSWFPCSM
jgi:hypothetical protein